MSQVPRLLCSRAVGWPSDDTALQGSSGLSDVSYSWEYLCVSVFFVEILHAPLVVCGSCV